ncbi:MAG TPA: hypothetical protein VN962_01365 [Polyangia bacterium]|nr:hypothetical protein [Polyangia bacterium]
MTRRAWTALAPFAFCACQQLNTPVYFHPDVPSLMVTGMNDTKDGPSRVETGVSLAYRTPSENEQKMRSQQAGALGFDVPWIQRDHVHIELVYQVTSNEPPPDPDAGASPYDGVASFSLGIDGANEYTKYDENIVSQVLQQGRDVPTFIPLIPVTPQTIAPGQTITGTVREDDFAEAELDLYAIGSWMAPYNAVLINNSQVDPIGLEMVPPNAIVPALVEVDVNFTANRPMTLTYEVRVRDDNNQLLHLSTDTLFSPAPALFQPPAPTP